MHSALAVVAASGLALGGCSLLTSLTSAPALFSGAQTVEQVDFEESAPGRVPPALDARPGDWAVADSPTARSGNQVLVRRGARVTDAVVKASEGAREVAGEVALRVLVGSSGAGIGCRGVDKGAWIVQLDPAAEKVELCRRSADALSVVDSASASLAKGEWTSVGIACRRGEVIAYLKGKPVIRRSAPLGSAIELLLYADAGVVAQFDDLRYSVRR